MTGSNSESGRNSIEEKKHDEAIETISSTSIPAYDGEVPPKLTPEQEKKLWRKIDLWLMPILTLMYLFSFLDRGASPLIDELELFNQIDITSIGNIGRS